MRANGGKCSIRIMFEYPDGHIIVVVVLPDSKEIMDRKLFLWEDRQSMTTYTPSTALDGLAIRPDPEAVSS